MHKWINYNHIIKGIMEDKMEVNIDLSLELKKKIQP